MTFLNRNRLLRFVFSLLPIALIILTVFITLKFFMPELLPMLESGNTKAIEKYIISKGAVGGLVCIAVLQIVQIWAVFLSGIPIQIAAGLVFGPVLGITVCLSASVLSLGFLYLCWRKIGRVLEKLFPIDEKQSSVMEKFVHGGTSPFFTVLISCLVPVMPNGLIPLLAIKVGASAKQFLSAVTVGILLNVVVCVSIGDMLADGDILASIVLFVLLSLLSLLMWKCQDKIMLLERHCAEYLKKSKFGRLRERFGHNR